MANSLPDTGFCLNSFLLGSTNGCTPWPDTTGIWVSATTDQLGITNHDFTVMAWVQKNNLHFDYTDQFVIGNAGQETLAGSAPNPGHDLQCGFRYNAAGANTFDTYFGFYGDDSYAADVPADQFIGPASSPTTTPWHHMTWRYTLSSGDQDIFVDGVLVNSDPGHSPLFGSSNLLIGRTAPGNGIAGSIQGAFAGLIEHPRVFNVALTDAQIASAAKYQVLSPNGCRKAARPNDVPTSRRVDPGGSFCQPGEEKSFRVQSQEQKLHSTSGRLVDNQKSAVRERPG